MTNPPDLQQTVLEKGNLFQSMSTDYFSLKYAVTLHCIEMTTLGKINRAIIFRLSMKKKLNE